VALWQQLAAHAGGRLDLDQPADALFGAVGLLLPEPAPADVFSAMLPKRDSCDQPGVIPSLQFERYGICGLMGRAGVRGGTTK
jgi:hypothetical protein